MNVHRLPILIILLSSIIVGCGTTRPDPIDVTINEIERAPLVLPKVDRLNLDPVYWYIISDRTAEEVFNDIVSKGYDPVLFGITDEGYRNLGINNQRILSLIRQQQAIIKAYEDYYKDGEQSKDGTGTNNNATE